jgi:hypothetical protein
MGKNIIAVLVAAIVAAAAGYYARGGGMCGSDKAVTLVARQDIKAGAVLTEDMLETFELPRLYMQQDSFEVRDMSDIKLAAGHTALVDIPKGNQVGRSSLKAPAGAVPAAPENPAQARYLEGIKYLQNSNYPKAAAEFEAALKLDPKHSEARAGLERVKKITAGGK